MPQFLLLLSAVPALIFGSATAAEKQELPMTQPVSVSNYVITAKSTDKTFDILSKNTEPINLIIHSDFTNHERLSDLCDFIEKNPQVVGVALGYPDDCFSCPPLDLTTAGSQHILGSLQKRSNLQCLTFDTKAKVEDEKFAESFSKLCLSMTNLTELKLHNIKFSEKSYSAIAKSITQNTHLQILELTRSVRAKSDEDAGAQVSLLAALEKMPASLKILSLTRLRLNGGSSHLLWRALSVHPDLMVLALSKSSIFISDLKILELSRLNALTTLDLSHNAISFDADIIPVFKGIFTANPNLKFLNLRSNPTVADEVVQYFIDALSNSVMLNLKGIKFPIKAILKLVNSEKTSIIL
jgi:hypothetical protein